MDYLLVAAGVLFLFLGGEALLRGAVSLARHLRVSPMIIGLTVVGFGTGAPELVVSLEAALTGQPAIAVGNVIGSNIANIFLILGLSAMIRSLPVPREALWRDGMVMLGASVLVVGFAMLGTMERWQGILLFAGLILFWGYIYRSERKNRSDELAAASAELDEDPVGVPRRVGIASLLSLVGLVALAFGSNVFLEGAVGLARTYGVSEAVIGLSLVAIGTSLPEVAAATVAAARGRGDVALGNVIGSNIINVLGILGLAAITTPLPLDAVTPCDLAVFVGGAVLALIFFFTGRRIARREGAFFLCGYGAYMWALFAYPCPF
ncbi:MAG: calcium/sodium antiporter [Kiloniellales bacterium]|nr:calcium/sodium antiporter [Kiloniellales bacterium]